MRFPHYVEKVVTEKIITVGDIYHTGNPTPPEGFEFTGEFREVKHGDIFFSRPGKSETGGRSPIRVAEHSSLSWDGPRLILREKAKKVRHIYEQVEDGPRYIKGGEFFCAVDGTLYGGVEGAYGSPGGAVLRNSISDGQTYASESSTKFIPLVYRKEEY